MKYNIENIFDHMQEIREEREQNERNNEADKNNATTKNSSVPELGSQEYIDNLDVPGAMDDGVALLLYIVAMVVGVIFKGRLLIWVFATILYLCHVFRRQIHKAKWDRDHKDK